MKILLLNPPGKRIYLRDYYCSKVSKADYIYHPVDLLILSGILYREAEVVVIDAIAERLSAMEVKARILKEKDLTGLVFLTGAVSWEEDFAFMEEIRKVWSGKILASGDIFWGEAERFLQQYEFIDGIIFDFTTDETLQFFRGEYAHLKSIAFKINGKAQTFCQEKVKGKFTIPVPRFELFPNNRYSFPFVRRLPFATVLTDFGCPYRCSFCIMAAIGFKYRPVDNIMAELDYIKQLGFKEIYFNDQTFGLPKERMVKLCQEMCRRNYRFGWAAWTRVDLMDKTLLRLLKEAGCHTIMFGVESANPTTLAETDKGYTLAEIKESFRLAHTLGLRTLGTFMIGLPGETREDILKTIRFSRELKADFASFNVTIPRRLTGLREEAKKRGWIRGEELSMDQSGTFTMMGNDFLSAGEIKALQRKAVRSFYLQPGYFFKRLVKVRTFYEIKRLLIGAWALIRNQIVDPLS